MLCTQTIQQLQKKEEKFIIMKLNDKIVHH